MKRTLLTSLILFLTVTLKGQTVEPFENFKNEVRKHWAQGQHSKSIELLLSNRTNYLEDIEQHLITYYLGLLYLEIGDYTKCSEVFNSGFDRSFFFSFWPSHLSKMKQYPTGKQIIERNTANRSIYQKEASAMYEVILPEDYNQQNAYPLLYFFHGNNSNIEYLKNSFQSIKLVEDVVIVLAQSSYARSNYAFDWIDSTSSRKSLLKIHSKVLRNYSIDSTQIIVGGFSNGGRMAIDIFTNKVIPTLGFIAFNPSEKSINADNMDNGRGAIITGERDYMLTKQINMANTLFHLSFQLRLVVLPDHDHSYPSSFGKELNESIRFILAEDE